MSQLQVIVDAYQPSNSIYVKFIVNDDELSKRLMTIDKKLKPLMGKDGKGVQLIVPDKAIESFMGGSILPKIFEMCSGSGFSLPSMDEVRDDIVVSTKSIITPKMKGEATSKANDLIEEFFKKYDDPEVMKIINQLMHDIKVNVGEDDKLSHAILSKRNRLLAYSQKRDATYIASQRTWRVVFGRKILPTAQVIIINAGNNGGEYDSNFANDKMGMDKNTAYGNSHTRISYDRVAKFGQSDPTNFYGVAYFDISDTAPYDDTDRFMDDAGLESNLTGSLNAKAMEDMPKTELSDEDNELLNKLGNNKTNESKIFSNIVEFCKDKPDYKAVMIAANGKDVNNPNSCADVVEALFRIKFEREHNQNLFKDKVKKCCAFVLSIYNAATNRMVSYMGQGNDVFNRKDLTEMYGQILDVVDIIDNTVKESIGGNTPTFKEFLDALHVDISFLGNNNNTNNNGYESNNNSVSDNNERDKLGESFRRLFNRIL